MSCNWQQKVHLFADNELGSGNLGVSGFDASEKDRQEVSAHLRDCSECANFMLQLQALKHSVRSAGLQFTAPEELRASIKKRLRPRRFGLPPVWRWSLAAACLFLIGLFGIFLYSNRKDDLMLAEVIDQHVTALASQNPVDVVSEDRHTVKPWFEGKLPFTFNLPESANPTYRLVGGKAVYLWQSPGAELIYDIGRHKASVFVCQSRDSLMRPRRSYQELSFTVDSWKQGDLEFYVVTDATKEEMEPLVAMFKEANRA